MLEIQNLILPNNRRINFSLSEGESLHIRGENGSGKTLLLRSIAQLIPVNYSKFEYRSKDITLWNKQDYRSQVLYLPANLNTQKLSIDDFFQQAYRLKIYSGHTPFFDYKKLISKWDIKENSFHQLSSGQKQILSILRVLNLKPKILLLDEPFSHLDEFRMAQALQLIEDWRLKTNGQLVFVSHVKADLANANELRLN